MTMQAFAVVVRLVEVDRKLGAGDVLCPDVMKPAHLRLVVAVKGVVRMASEAGVIAGYAVVLEVCSGNPVLVVHLQTAAVRLHDVAGQAELSCL